MVDRHKLRARIAGDNKLNDAIRGQVKGDHHVGEGDLKVIQISQIRRNPNNPRELKISVDDIEKLRFEAAAITGVDEGVEASEEFLAAISTIISKAATQPEEHDTLEKIFLLAKSIWKRGLLQPISVFDDGERQYTIRAGERRFLAHVLLGRPSIRALVRERQGDQLEDRVDSLIENIAREDLSTSEKINYIALLVETYEINNHPKSMSVEDLHELIHESKRSCYRYLRIIRSPGTIMQDINSGVLASIRDIERRIREEAGEDDSDDLSHEIPPSPFQMQQTESDSSTPALKKRGRERKVINLGKVQNPSVVHSIIKRSMGEHKVSELFAQMDWSNLEQVQNSWEIFLKEMSKVAESEN